MAKKLYRVVDDPSIEDRWYLRAPVDSLGNEIDPRIFTRCTSYQSAAGRMSVPLRRPGKPVSFTFGDFDMPVVNGIVKQLVARNVDDDHVQWIDVDVEQSGDTHAILNVLSCISCIDERRSEFTKWQEADERPDKIGQYRMFSRIVIDPDRCGKAEIFRIAEWKIALVVSKRLKRALEAVEGLGVRFEPVN